MSIHTTYSRARAEFASLCSEVTDNQEIVFIKRRGKEPVALVSAGELASLLETAHLLRSPKNARRLLAALKRTEMHSLDALPVNELRRELGLE